MKLIGTLISAAALASSLGAFAADNVVKDADGVKVEIMGLNNTLVRITGDGKYLLLPIEDTTDDDVINILKNGKTEQTINARLAKSKVDYFVPVDLTPFRDGTIALNIKTHQSRNSVREVADDAAWSAMVVSDEFDSSNKEKYRPVYHHSPTWGWMNDPNGMVYKDGVWHLYYQHNPYGSRWQNLSWGHATSTDLVHWEQQGDPVTPDGLGLIFSGSSAIDKTNSAGFGKYAIVSMWTSCDATQQQSLGHSTDNGQTFTVYEGNPTITLATEARDPNFFWDEKNQKWVLLLAHALEHEMLVFTSPDMKEWTLESSFGKGLGAQDGVWECPDLFELPVEGTDGKKWVLLCNINPGGPFGGSGTQYFVGEFDGKKFTADTDANGNVPTKWLDFGKDHYATVSWSDAPDNRRTLVGWMSNWQYANEVPTLQYRSANTLPREIGLFTGADGEIYASSAPSPELLALRDKASVSVAKKGISAKPATFKLPTANDGICEIELAIDPKKASSVELTLANAAGDKSVVTYNVADKTVSFDRTKSGLVDFSHDFPAVTTTSTFSDKDTVTLRLFIDRSSVELFGDNGRFVMTNLVFPTAPYSTLSIKSAGGNAQVSNLRIYPVKY